MTKLSSVTRRLGCLVMMLFFSASTFAANTYTEASLGALDFSIHTRHGDSAGYEQMKANHQVLVQLNEHLTKEQPIKAKNKLLLDEWVTLKGDQLLVSGAPAIDPFLDDGTEFDTKFSVVNEESLAAVSHYSENGAENIVMLNFAQPRKCGGGYLGGDIAQEEANCYPTNLWHHLKDAQMAGLYGSDEEPNLEKGVIVSEGVVLQRQSRAINFKLREKPINFIVISAAAPNLNCESKNNNLAKFGINLKEFIPEGLNPEDLKKYAVRKPIIQEYIATIQVNGRQHEFYKAQTKIRIRTILTAALPNRRSPVILGAWGTGVYENPSDLMAQFFKEVFQEKAFANKFKEIRFSILVNNDNDPRFKAFKKQFIGD